MGKAGIRALHTADTIHGGADDDTILIEKQRLALLGAGADTIAALILTDAFGGIDAKLTPWVNALRIGTPLTAQRAPFQKHFRTDPRAIMYRKVLDIEYDSFILRHCKTHFLRKHIIIVDSKKECRKALFL